MMSFIDPFKCFQEYLFIIKPLLVKAALLVLNITVILHQWKHVHQDLCVFESRLTHENLSRRASLSYL